MNNSNVTIQQNNILDLKMLNEKNVVYPVIYREKHKLCTKIERKYPKEKSSLSLCDMTLYVFYG